MNLKTPPRPTIGFISTWAVYVGTTIDSYTHTLLQGIRAAALEYDCNLLIGCGISLPGDPPASRTAWATPGANVDFVPVGPWNADGLIIIPDDLFGTQFEYVQDLIQSGYPIVLTTAEKPGPLVAVDNAGGIRQAFDHLWQHGHRQIAFIAGKKGRGGDSAERLAAYRAALHDAGMKEDDCLIAFGEHRREGGRVAMQRILDTRVPFTAVIASNDLSALGAMEVLRDAGRRIPDDVAIVGFDDILEARSQLPPLTTVRHPTFTLGYQAVLSLLEAIEGIPLTPTPLPRKRGEGLKTPHIASLKAGGKGQGDRGTVTTRVATQLVVRQSCGCRPNDAPLASLDQLSPLDLEATQTAVAYLMTESAFVEVRHSPREQIEALCLNLVQAFTSSLSYHAPDRFDRALQVLFDWLESHDEDAYAWHAAFSSLRSNLPTLLSAVPRANLSFADALIDRARVTIAELAQRQAANELLHHREMSNRLGLMTSQLLATFDTAEIANILAQHLPQLAIEHALVVLFSPEADDPLSQSTVLLNVGLPINVAGKQFNTREFPSSGIYPSETPFQLAILPLMIDERRSGFVALSATNLESCAAIVRNLVSALRTSQLYHDALESRQLAEDANRLKSRFLSMVSHELQTPLSLIVGLSEMIMTEPLDPPDGVLRDIGQINTSAQHLGYLIGDILDLARSEAGEIRITREPLDLVEVLHTVAKIGEPMARDKGLGWTAQLPDARVWVHGDQTRLRQVVLNLISNAVKFTQEGQVVLSVAVTDQQITVSVSDTGIGVPSAEQEKVFHEFYRLERTVRAGIGGLGLGLAISKQLVERHGGNLGVRSPGDLGTGSTFFFSLPVISITGSSTALPELHGNAVVVLTEQTVPDEKLIAYLRERGFDVHVCHKDEESEWLSAVIATPPAALILGRDLAAREGWTIISILKQQTATEHIPVLVYSLDLERDQGELLELNYQQKPLQRQTLAAELARYAEPSDQRTILVVDDDPNILAMNTRLVKQIGCHVLTARNGREALQVIEQDRPDLILLDLMMPEMDGFAVLDALRARDSTRDIPVIILTARMLSEADLEYCNRGVAAILGKGLFNASETLHHIEAALSRRNTLGRTTQRLLRQAMAYIHTHYAESLSREDIAAQVGISGDYLTDCFNQELGITPMTYLRRYRVRQARELLETSDLSIMQIAFAVGFAESAHFTRTFQREVGMTPSAYRHGKRNGSAFQVEK